MRINVLKPENNCVIIDEEYYKYLKRKAELNEAKIEELASDKYPKTIKESGVELSYQINGIPQIFHKDLVNELNYNGKGLPESVSEEAKYAIADNITDYLNKRFAHWKNDCEAYARSILDGNRGDEVKFWKGFCIGFLFVLIIYFLC